MTSHRQSTENRTRVNPETRGAIEFGRRLVLAMEAAAVTRDQLAADLGRRPATITDWRAGRSTPDVPDLQRIRSRLRCSWAALLGPDWQDDLREVA